MHYASERKGLQRCGAAKLAKKKKISPRERSDFLTHGFGSSTMSQPMYILLFPAGAVISPGREITPWEVGSGCLVPLAQCPADKQTDQHSPWQMWSSSVMGIS